ncbi:hypothetical protein NDU88_001630 [Pleurodeles waltl]|uniref:Uncharacterized protein n=1 Tax=Pleurodeles waltl TaxID=8319 RepID=A0AAV7ND56_PLEWA|nr:hypothetical protein NDU88_001630 [Pleurodeles waltl]
MDQKIHEEAMRSLTKVSVSERSFSEEENSRGETKWVLRENSCGPSSWDPERRGWQPKDKNTRTAHRAEKRSTRIRSRLRKRRDAGSAAEKRRRRKRDRRIDARSRRNDAQHR